MKVSICIPTFNQSQYVSQAIKSAFDQTLQPYEIIVSDDCSTDDTAAVLKALSEEIPILKVISQEHNLGIAKNTDSCLRSASGDFIVRLDSDDYLAPDYLNTLAGLLKQQPLAGYAHGAVQEINQFGANTKIRKLYRKPGFQSADKALQAAIAGYRVAANIIMFRKEALQKVNYTTGRPNYVEDFHLSASLASAGYGNMYTDRVLSFYRVWIDNGKVRQRRKLMEIVGLYKVFEDVLIPAFRAKSWRLVKLNRSRANLAVRQSDCLGWDVYTVEEKLELKNALSQLSSSTKALFFAWLHINGYGKYVNFFFNIKNSSKNFIKSLIS
jgi:glycosyltransferase involved in cell wall biosynthesis